MTVVPLAAESVPAVVVQAALPGAWVRLTSSPTPILVRVRSPGVVATVWLVMVSTGAGGGAGPGPGGTGPGPGGAGAANRASKFPIVSGPTIPSGFNECALW